MGLFQNLTRRQFIVTLKGVLLGTYFLPDSGQPVDPTADATPTRNILGGVRKLNVGKDFTLMWTEVDASGEVEVWTWTPADKKETAEAKRFYDAARGVGPDAPEGRRIRSGSVAKRSAEEQKYLDAILARPDDDRPYYEYADWLCSRGNAYGDYLRASVAWERAPKDSAHANALEATCAALVEKHGETWIKPLTDLGFQPEIMGHRNLEFWFTKGVISDFTIDRPGVLPERATRFFNALPLLRELTIEDDENDIGKIAQLPQMAQIQTLSFSGTIQPQQFIDLCRSPHLKKLRKLDLDFEYQMDHKYFDESIGRAVGEAQWLDKLEFLSLDNAPLGDEGIRLLVNSIRSSSLTHLSLEHTADCGIGFSAIASSPHMGNLKTLLWSSNCTNAESISTIRSASFLYGLLELDLSAIGLPATTAKDLATAKFGRLESLNYSINHLDGNGMSALLSAPWLANVRRLDLGYTSIGNLEATQLAGYPFSKLEELRLDSNPFGLIGVRALCQGPPWSSLEKLDIPRLQGPDVDNNALEIVKTVANCSRFPNLTRLSLDGIKIGSDGAEVLARSTTLTKLKTLIVDSDAMSPASKKSLTKRFGKGVVDFA